MSTGETSASQSGIKTEQQVQQKRLLVVGYGSEAVLCWRINEVDFRRTGELDRLNRDRLSRLTGSGWVCIRGHSLWLAYFKHVLV